MEEIWVNAWHTTSWYAEFGSPGSECSDVYISAGLQGSGFIAYGTIMAILLLVGEAWVRRSGRSPEWWDSWVITLWVCQLPFLHLRTKILTGRL